ncbi:hypothetical protein GCM10007973_13000 [Polymorphobacter multimanifer]|uniref:Uncharacterized protein n=1 Tax=Polymorphobacter multimanifer TaxID=1070431 RepID=A0A841LFW8_9SPHN|nr:hypothetical protein [Polymorphobacter multimanifer]MBB6227858.1 hypothetical protein [Polymorphobacter multimanifer]GGI77543.1 hypothetical protein GCM10007973_13000 [Polymorphobacter multimanifer]
MRWVPAAVVVVLGLSAAGAYYEVPSRLFDRSGSAMDEMEDTRREAIADARQAAEDARADSLDAATNARADVLDAASRARAAAADAAAIDWDDPAWNDEENTVFALDTGAGSRNSMALNLPGGFGIKVPFNEKMDDADRFKVDGVGPFPGASMNGLRVRAFEDGRGRSGDNKRAQVEMSFDAPAPPRTVINWYEREFGKKGTRFERRGDRLLGRTTEGKAFELTARPSGRGTAGLFRVREDS